MAKFSINGKTLRQKINLVEKMVRELEDHLENGFLPKTKNLRRSVKDFNPESTDSSASDTIIRDNASLVIASERFARNLAQQITPTLDAIEDDLKIIVNGE